MSLAETFDFFALCLHFRAAKPLKFASGGAANFIRGALGKNLTLLSQEAYARWFAPTSLEGPSGLRDRPRPFVLRVSNLDEAKIDSGASFRVRLNVFDERAIPDLTHALQLIAQLESAKTERISPSFDPAPAERIRVQFLTPTELKGSDEPDFHVLWARLRDRISTLRALYGPGPLNINFKEMAGRASKIRMTRCEIRDLARERVSRTTGQRHSLGGFIGFAEYEGELDDFIPYLEIGRHTGVGRQTVWGKGEIRVGTF